MDYDPSRPKGWETILNIPFDERIIKLCNANLPDFIKGMAETAHNRGIMQLNGSGEFYLPLPRTDLAGEGDTLHETTGSRYENGWHEVVYHRSVRDADNKEKEHLQILLKHFIWGNQPPSWHKRAGVSGEFEEYEPTKDEVANFRTKCIDGLVVREEVRKRIAAKAGKKTVDILDVRSNLL